MSTSSLHSGSSELTLFMSYNRERATQIQSQLHLLETQLAAHINAISPTMQPLVGQLIEQCEGGKKIRGSLITLGYELAGGTQPGTLDVLSAAIELFQTSILIHDDIIDQSPLRRGRATIHESLGGHYGLSQALCIGDIGFFFANKLITQLDLPDSIKIRLIQSFSDMVIATGTGEMLDIELPHQGTANYQEILDIMIHKTARYTIGYPLVLGAIAAGTDDRLIDHLLSFGDAVGIAFQIADDIQGIYGSVQSLGKPNVSDIEENKQTLLLRYTKDHATPDQLLKLQHLYGTTGLTTEQIDRIKKLFEETGAVDYAKQEMHQYLDRASMILDHMAIQEQHSLLMRGLVQMVSTMT